MHPKAYFIFHIALTMAVAVGTFILSALVLSFIVFSVHESGEQFLLGFGGQGIATFFAIFPWLSLIADIALLFLLEWLLQGFKLGYRFSLISVFAGVLVLSALLAVLVGLTPIHRTLLDRADKGALPLIGGMYEGIRDSHQERGIFRGTITSVQDNQIIISHDDGDHDADDGTQTVVLPQDGAVQLQAGDRVYVFGNAGGGVIQAFGVQKLSDDQ